MATPTPVFLPGESQGRESLVGCCLWGRTESDTTEATQQQQQQQHDDNARVEEGWDLLWGGQCVLPAPPPASLRGAPFFGPGLSLCLPSAPSASF